MYSNVLCRGVGRVLLRSVPKTGHVTKCLAVAGIHTTSQKNDAIGDLIQRLRFRFYHDPRHHMDHDKWCKIFTVEGNIKSGKGDFAKEFAERMDLRYFPSADYTYVVTAPERQTHPDEMDFLLDEEHWWKRHIDISLERFYTEPEDIFHMGRFTMHTNRARFYQYADAVVHMIRTGQGVVIERGFHTLSVFEHAIKKMNWMNHDLRKFLYEHRMYMEQRFVPPHAAIYLDVSPEKCLENIKKDGTPAEQRITLEYLKAMEEGYMNYLAYAEKRGTKIIQFDWEKSQDIDEALMEMDNMSSLEHDYNRWDHKAHDNRKLKAMMRTFQDQDSLQHFTWLYPPFDEMNSPHWMHYAYPIYRASLPKLYPSGFDPKKDRWLWLKEPAKVKSDGWLA